MNPRPPSPAELRRGERAAWGARPAAEPPRSTPGVIASNFKPIDKNTLKATADVAVPHWRMKIRGVMWHSKGDSEWIAFPSREWIDKDGKRQFATLLEFTDKHVETRFKVAVLAAMRELVRTEHPGDFGDGATRPGSRAPRSHPATERLYSSPKQPRGSGPAVPDDRVDDLWPEAGP